MNLSQCGVQVNACSQGTDVHAIHDRTGTDQTSLCSFSQTGSLSDKDRCILDCFLMQGIL